MVQLTAEEKDKLKRFRALLEEVERQGSNGEGLRNTAIYDEWGPVEIEAPRFFLDLLDRSIQERAWIADFYSGVMAMTDEQAEEQFQMHIDHKRKRASSFIEKAKRQIDSYEASGQCLHRPSCEKKK